MPRIRLGVTASVSTFVAVLLAASLQPAAAATHRSPAYTGVVGRSTHYVVFDDYSNHTAYLAAPDGTGAATVLARHAVATVVSGDLVEYTVGRRTLWRKLGTSHHGIVPARWAALAPDGGLRISRSGNAVELQYRHLDGTTEHLALPAAMAIRGGHYRIVAGTAGVVVAASAAGQVPRIVFAAARQPTAFRPLNATGLPHGASLSCSSVSTLAVGCLAGHRVVRLATDGRTAPQVARLDTAPLRVAVTDTATSWTAPRSASSRRACPCTLTTIDASGTALSIVAGLTSRTLTAGNGTFYYSAQRTRSTAGVYATRMAGTGDRRIARAAPRG